MLQLWPWYDAPSDFDKVIKVIELMKMNNVKRNDKKEGEQLLS